MRMILFLLLIAAPLTGRAQSFGEFLASLRSQPDKSAKAAAVDRYLTGRSVPVVENDTIHFIYRGKGNVAAVPGEMNGWSPGAAVMEHVEGTDLFHLSASLPPDARVEYKIWVDSLWMLDPLNPLRARGGYGENSECKMPGYVDAGLPEGDPDAPHGTLDTLAVPYTKAGIVHPVIVYLPPGVKRTDRRVLLPVLYVTDGGDYLTLGGLGNALDRLISAKRIRPCIAVCIDPRTDLADPSTNRRMIEYAASDTFLEYLGGEVIPMIERRYPASPDRRVILGASMGGLIATYAAVARPDLFRGCAAQSPAYTQADNAVIRRISGMGRIGADVVMQTGTINDTEKESVAVRDLLSARGARVLYSSHHEGHNWTAWRTRLAPILEHFYGTKDTLLH